MGPLLAAFLLVQAAGATSASPEGAPLRPGASVQADARRGEQPVDPYVQADANAGATPLAGTKTFEAFHGAEGLHRIASGFVDRNTTDPRLKDIFATADTVRLKRLLAEQFCYLLGGGCAYTGRDMGSVHKGQGLQNADFNAVVENLQAAMDDEHVPFRAQNLLLAKLAPMQRTVVERKSPALLKEVGRQFSALALAH